MSTAQSINIIENGKGSDPEIQVTTESVADPNRWSRAVRSWIVEFQEHDADESLPAFDSLFRDGPGALGRD